MLEVRVACVDRLTPEIRRFTLVADRGIELPRYSAGSHVLVRIPGRNRDYRNPYSLIGNPSSTSTYQIAVRRAERSRGGSAHMHDAVKPGARLWISPPLNSFPIDRLAHRHLMIAGGIGITPFMAYVYELLAMDAAFELHYAFADRRRAALLEALPDLATGSLMLYDGSAGERVAPCRLLSTQPLGTHVYVCGPPTLIETVRRSAQALGWPRSHVHWEQFSAPATGRSFTVRLARSGRALRVRPDKSLLEALEEAGVPVPNLCRAGVCGHCRIRMLAGEAEHCDDYLSDEDKAAQQHIMPCVSRARGDRITLDL